MTPTRTNSPPVARAVGEHLDQRPLVGNLARGEDAEENEPHVAHAGIGDEPLEIGLGEGEKRAVDDADRPEPAGERGQRPGCVGEHGKSEPNETVASRLQEKTGEDDASGGRGLGVRVGEPDVKRNDG